MRYGRAPSNFSPKICRFPLCARKYSLAPPFTSLHNPILAPTKQIHVGALIAAFVRRRVFSTNPNISLRRGTSTALLGSTSTAVCSAEVFVYLEVVLHIVLYVVHFVYLGGVPHRSPCQSPCWGHLCPLME